jgi:hypothetical protein
LIKPKLHKKKASKKGREKKTRGKDQSLDKPKRGEPHGGKGTTKYGNFHQSLEAYRLKKGEVNQIQLQD